MGRVACVGFLWLLLVFNSAAARADVVLQWNEIAWLEPALGPVEIPVIESVEQPTPD